jgi:hypothetical protein
VVFNRVFYKMPRHSPSILLLLLPFTYFHQSNHRFSPVLP